MNKNKGVTMVELMIASAILASIMILSMSFTTTLIASNKKEFNKQQAQSSINNAVNRIQKAFALSSSSMAYAIAFSSPVNSVLIFPTAINKQGKFVPYETNEYGEITLVSSDPIWQGYIIVFCYKGKLVMLTDYREEHQFTGKKPYIIYPDDLEDDYENVLCYSDHAIYDDGSLVEWEFPKDVANMADVENSQDMKVDILAHDINSFSAKLAGNKLEVSLTLIKQINAKSTITAVCKSKSLSRNNK